MGQRVTVPGVLACPHCAQPLSLGDASATCAQGHSFDRAREGYFNLLVGGRISSATTPGDAPDALEARRRFLAGGSYAPIAQALAAMVGAADGPVLDVGCGEGYYLSQLAVPDRLGLDVSKRAVQLAARLLPDSQFVVGSAYRLPVVSGTLAVVLSVFAPHPLDEFLRVLRPGGRWVTVTPGPRHLHELRPVLQGDAREKDVERLARRAEPPEDSAVAERVQFTLQPSVDALRDLFFMTPIRWQSGAAATVAGGTVREVTVDVWVAAGAPAGLAAETLPENP